MRILVANDLYGPSSAAGVATASAAMLASRGHEVQFLATVQERERARTFVEPSGMKVRLEYTAPYDLRWRSWKSCWNPTAVRIVRETVESIRPDVVHFHNVHIHLSYRSLAAARVTGAPVLLTVHDVMPFCFQKMFCFVNESLDPKGPPISFKAPMPRCIPCARFRYNPVRNPWIRWHFEKHLARVLAVSDEMHRALNENGIDNVETVFNGVPKRDLLRDDVVAEFKTRFRLAGKKVVLYGGRLDHRKGAEHLIRAMGQVKAKAPNAVLLVVGSGMDGYEQTMLKLAGELGIGDSIVSTGWLDQDAMRVAYSAADVICTPSLIYESFGLINAEGMLFGKPAVTAFFGGPKDVVEDGVSGIHVNPLDVDSLAAALSRLLVDDALRERMGRAARERMLTKFAMEEHVAQLERIYAEVQRGAKGAS